MPIEEIRFRLEMRVHTCNQRESEEYGVCFLLVIVLVTCSCLLDAMLSYLSENTNYSNEVRFTGL